MVSQLDCLINSNKSDNKKLYLDPTKALYIPPKPNNAASVSQARSNCSRQVVASVSEHFLEVFLCLVIL